MLISGKRQDFEQPDKTKVNAQYRENVMTKHRNAIPVPPRHLHEPDLAVPVLEWWADCYDYVFVVLNPFFRVPGYTPETAAYGPEHVGSLSNKSILALLKNLPDRANEAPANFEDIVKKTGEPLRWIEIQREIGADDFQTFARTAWLWTVHTDRQDRDPQIALALEAYCQKNDIYPPEEDMLPAVLEPVIGKYLNALGLDSVEIWNEWRNVSREIQVSDLAPDAPSVEIPREKTSAVAAPGLIMSWGFDDTYGLLGLSDALKNRVDPDSYFEGFWVTPDMYCDVFNPVGFFDRQPPKRPL